MPQPFYRVIDSKISKPTLFKNEYPIFLSKNSLLELDVVFHIKLIPKSIQPNESLDDKSIYNSIIAEEFGCPREMKECSEMVLNIDLNYSDDRTEFSKSFPLRLKLDFAGKISPTGGIISNYKVTPFTVLGHRMKEYVATVMYAGSGGEKEIFQKMETKELQKHFLANNSDFDICSALFTRVVTDRDFVYASIVLSNCRPSSRSEESMLKNNYGVLAIEEKNYSKGLAYLLEAQKIERCNYLSDKNLFEYYMFANEYHKATEVALKRLLDCKNQIDHWAHVLYSLFPEQKDHQNIIEALKHIAGTNPSDGNIQFYLGEAYKLDNKQEEAIVYYQNSIQLDTIFRKQALAEASNVFRIRGEYANSEKLANQLMELDNDSFLGHYHAAYANFMLRKYEEAVRHYETALKIRPNHFAVLYELGEMYSHLGQDDKAYSYKELAKKYWPSGYGMPIVRVTPKPG